MDRESAKLIALDHANISVENARDLEIDLDREWGVLLYEVSFEAGRLEYEYEIDAYSGEILFERATRDR